jgi:type I restriction enzyme M protein
MFVQAFRAIDDCLRQEAGCGTELDSTEQTSWLLFLKILDGGEDDNAPLTGDDRLPGGETGVFARPMAQSRSALHANASYLQRSNWPRSGSKVEKTTRSFSLRDSAL